MDVFKHRADIKLCLIYQHLLSNAIHHFETVQFFFSMWLLIEMIQSIYTDRCPIVQNKWLENLNRAAFKRFGVGEWIFRYLLCACCIQFNSGNSFWQKIIKSSRWQTKIDCIAFFGVIYACVFTYGFLLSHVCTKLYPFGCFYLYHLSVVLVCEINADEGAISKCHVHPLMSNEIIFFPEFSTFNYILLLFVLVIRISSLQMWHDVNTGHLSIFIVL